MATVFDVRGNRVEIGAEGVIFVFGLKGNEVVRISRSPNARISAHAYYDVFKQAAKILRDKKHIKKTQPSLF